MNFEQERAPGLPWPAFIAWNRSLGTAGVVVAYLILGALTLSPLLWVTTPALVDYPNHLARMWILVHGRDIPELASNYAAHWRILPDLAMDLIVPALAQVMSVEAAGRVFVALTMASLAGGTAALHRALHGRVGLWPIVAWLFVYNLALAWGFLNCVFGIGAALFAFAGWIVTRQWRAAPRLALFAIIASVLFILHLFAFGLYGLAVASYEIGNRLTDRRYSWSSFFSLCAAGTQFIPALAFWVASLAESGPSVTRYGSLDGKLYAAFAPFAFNTTPQLFDRMLILLCVSFWLVGRMSRAITLAPAMRVPLAVMLGAAIAMPHVLNGSAGADARLPVALLFIVIASMRIDEKHFRLLGLFAALALVFLGLRVWAVSTSWQDYDAHFTEFRAADRVIAPGARLLIVDAPLPESEQVIAGVPHALAARASMNFAHMPGLAVIDRSVFMPYLFSGWTSISPTARNAGLFKTSAPPLSPEDLATAAKMDEPDSPYAQPDLRGELPYWRDWAKHFDYLLWVDFGANLLLPQEKNLTPVATGSFFKIYRIVRP